VAVGARSAPDGRCTAAVRGSVRLGAGALFAPAVRVDAGKPTLVVACLGTFLISLDLTILTIAIPTIGRAFNAPIASLVWLTNAYVLALASGILIAGRLGDLYGQRRLLILGLAAFTVASGLCAVAATATELTMFRALQGLGAALMLPQTIALISRVVHPSRRATYLGVLGAVAGGAGVSALTAGGALIGFFGWRSIFVLNVPVGAFALAIAFRFIPRVGERTGGRVDVVGAVLVAATLVVVSYVLMEGPPHGWRFLHGSIGVATPLFVAVSLGLTAWIWERSQQGKSPLVSFGLLRSPPFWLMCSISFGVSIALIGTTVPVSLYLQSDTSRSPLEAGLLLLPLSVFSLMFSPLSGRMADRFGGRAVLLVGLAGYTIAIVILTVCIATGAPLGWLLLSMSLLGLSNSSVYAPVNAIALTSVDSSCVGMASGVLNTARQLGFIAGGALVAGLLPIVVSDSLAAETSRAVGGFSAVQSAAARSSVLSMGHGGNLPSTADAAVASAGSGLPQRWLDGTAQRAIVLVSNRRSMELLLPIGAGATALSAGLVLVDVRRRRRLASGG